MRPIASPAQFLVHEFSTEYHHGYDRCSANFDFLSDSMSIRTDYVALPALNRLRFLGFFMILDVLYGIHKGFIKKS
jgi:hypothetical protein